MELTAHIRDSDGVMQSVAEHSQNVSKLCGQYLSSVGLSNVGTLIGLLHDAGKLSKTFDDYINKRNDLSRGSIDHSYAGAKYLCELCTAYDERAKLAITSMAHTIVSHHGLHDWADENGKDYFDARTGKSENYTEIQHNLTEIISRYNVDFLLKASISEWNDAAAKAVKISEKSEQCRVELAFYIGMLERLMQSALIDADRTDTADFMSAYTVHRDLHDNQLWSIMDDRMDEKLAQFTGTDIITKTRHEISDSCAAFSQHKVGACRLIVPTGGSKTLSSLRFAIKQCKKYNMQHIFYIAPFMSILEQNSEVLKEIAGAENFLEHHSNIVSELNDASELEQYQLLTENWDVSVIATTMVQFFNALFSNKTSCVRRFHRLKNSVIIIDEVQSVPIRCTDLFTLAVNFLTRICGSCVVLCSATQPSFESNTHKLLLDEQSDMVKEYNKYFEPLRRTNVIPKLSKFGYDNNEAADLCCDKFYESFGDGNSGNLLVILNTKKQARSLFELLLQKLEGKAEVIHLSSNMCPAHRRKVIKRLKELLISHRSVICVTTQLIEAGVDISFKCVVRALAGLDNAAQAAGRCNRSGEQPGLCPVYLINLKEEALGNLEQIKTAQSISRSIIDNEKEQIDILSVYTQKLYSQEMFRLYSDKLSYNVFVTTSGTKLQTNILQLLSTNKLFAENGSYISQAFKTAGELFNVIDKDTSTVITAFDDEADKLICKLKNAHSPAQAAQILRKLQKYCVEIYAQTKRELENNGALKAIQNSVYILRKDFYDEHLGVVTENSSNELILF